jgi:hypothetical protein
MKRKRNKNGCRKNKYDGRAKRNQRRIPPGHLQSNNALNFAAAAPASRAQCGPGSAGNQSNAGANKPRKLAWSLEHNNKND